MDTMHPRPSYLAPRTIEDAMDFACVAGSALMSGGTIVMPQLSRNEMVASRLIDLTSLPEAAAIVSDGACVTINACVTYAILLEAVCPGLPDVLRQLSRGITGGPQIRHQGTLAGSACHANPASDVPTGLVAANAKFTLVSRARGYRRICAADFFVGPFATLRAADEILTSIVVPRSSSTDLWGYCKFKVAEASWPIAVAAAAVRASRNGSCQEVTITIGAATERPVRLECIQLEAADSLPERARAQIYQTVQGADLPWWEDHFTDRSYRRQIAGRIATRAVERALSTAGSS